jgi:hypothetical protein
MYNAYKLITLARINSLHVKIKTPSALCFIQPKAPQTFAEGSFTNPLNRKQVILRKEEVGVFIAGTRCRSIILRHEKGVQKSILPIFHIEYLKQKAFYPIHLN